MDKEMFGVAATLTPEELKASNRLRFAINKDGGVINGSPVEPQSIIYRGFVGTLNKKTNVCPGKMIFEVVDDNINPKNIIPFTMLPGRIWQSTGVPEDDDDVAGLIECVDCGGDVSRRAKTCPHCGGPVDIVDRINAQVAHDVEADEWADRLPEIAATATEITPDMQLPTRTRKAPVSSGVESMDAAGREARSTPLVEEGAEGQRGRGSEGKSAIANPQSEIPSDPMADFGAPELPSAGNGFAAAGDLLAMGHAVIVEAVEVGGKKHCVRVMGGPQFDAYDAWRSRNPKCGNSVTMAALLAFTVCDPTGKLLYVTEAQARGISTGGEKSGAAAMQQVTQMIHRLANVPTHVKLALFNKAAEMNGLTQTAQEAIRKNS